MNNHHARAVRISVFTLLLDLGLGLAYGYVQGIGPYHGIYCSIGITTTVGCDVNPSGTAARWLVLGMICSIPLAGAILSLFTTGLLADHIDKGHAQLRKDLQREPAGQPATVGGAPAVPGGDKPGDAVLKPGS